MQKQSRCYGDLIVHPVMNEHLSGIWAVFDTRLQEIQKLESSVHIVATKELR